MKKWLSRFAAIVLTPALVVNAFPLPQRPNAAVTTPEFFQVQALMLPDLSTRTLLEKPGHVSHSIPQLLSEDTEIDHTRPLREKLRGALTKFIRNELPEAHVDDEAEVLSLVDDWLRDYILHTNRNFGLIPSVAQEMFDSSHDWTAYQFAVLQFLAGQGNRVSELITHFLPETSTPAQVIKLDFEPSAQGIRIWTPDRLLGRLFRSPTTLKITLAIRPSENWKPSTPPDIVIGGRLYTPESKLWIPSAVKGVQKVTYVPVPLEARQRGPRERADFALRRPRKKAPTSIDWTDLQEAVGGESDSLLRQLLDRFQLMSTQARGSIQDISSSRNDVTRLVFNNLYPRERDGQLTLVPITRTLRPGEWVAMTQHPDRLGVIVAVETNMKSGQPRYHILIHQADRLSGRSTPVQLERWSEIPKGYRWLTYRSNPQIGRKSSVLTLPPVLDGKDFYYSKKKTEEFLARLHQEGDSGEIGFRDENAETKFVVMGGPNGEYFLLKTERPWGGEILSQEFIRNTLQAEVVACSLANLVGMSNIPVRIVSYQNLPWIAYPYLENALPWHDLRLKRGDLQVTNTKDVYRRFVFNIWINASEHPDQGIVVPVAGHLFYYPIDMKPVLEDHALDIRPSKDPKAETIISKAISPGSVEFYEALAEKWGNPFNIRKAQADITEFIQIIQSAKDLDINAAIPELLGDSDDVLRKKYIEDLLWRSDHLTEIVKAVQSHYKEAVERAKKINLHDERPLAPQHLRWPNADSAA